MPTLPPLNLANFKLPAAGSPASPAAPATNTALPPLNLNNFKLGYTMTHQTPDTIPTTADQINAEFRTGQISAPSAVIQDVGEAAQETNQALNSPWSPIGWVSDAIGGATNLLAAPLSAIDKFIAPKIGTALRNAVGAQTANSVGQKLAGVANSPTAKTFSSPDVAGDLEAVGKVAQLGMTAAGVGTAAPALGDVGKAMDIGQIADSLKENAGPAGSPKEVAAKITQATGSDVETTNRALSSIDTTGVKTYSGLSKVLNAKIQENTAGVDTALGSNTDTYKPDDLQKEIPVSGGKSVVTNPVADSLSQLQTFYEKTNDPQNLARIQNLQTQFETDGLTVKEINDVAREHGRELNGYNANGELASGLSKQAAENTRQGVKDVVRSLNPNDTTASLDKNTSDLIATKGMVDDMATKVEQLENKIRKYTPLQQLGRFGGKALDLFTGGIAKAFLRSIQGFGNNEGTTMNVLDLQESLQNNLTVLDRLNAMNPDQVMQEFGKMLTPPPNQKDQ